MAVPVPSPLPAARSAVRSLLTGHPDGAAPWVRDLGRDGDDGWFGPGSTIWRVHADAATLVGGIRALLVQAMHPVVLAGFDQHSDYREDPESRLQRTAAFVTVTTFGTSAQAERACDRVRRAHATVRGATDDGRPYRADDPDLLGWVHLALVDSLAVAVRQLGHTAFDLDDYLYDTAVVGERLQAGNVPRDAAGLAESWRHYRPQLGCTPATERAHRFLLDPPLPWRIRSAASATLPPDLRPLLGARPLLPDPAARLVGRAATALLSGVLGESPAAAAAARRTSSARRAS